MPADILPARRPSAFDSFMRGLRLVLGPIASLKITVALFVLSGLLVFFGTLAQKGQGVWTVVDNYFYSWFVMVEFQYLLEFGKVFLGVRADASTAAWPTWLKAFPFPAGKLLGWAMVVNLSAAHFIQFFAIFDGVIKQATRTRSTAAEVMLIFLKRSGIFVLHAGVLLMLVGEAVTRAFAVEQQMLIPEGGSSNYAYETRNWEVAFVDRTDPNVDKVAVLPSGMLKAAAPSTRISHDSLPVDVEVVAYFTNSRVVSIDDAIQEAVANSLPPKEAAAARNEVLADAVAVLQAFDAARGKRADEPPLDLLQKTLAEVGAGRFQSAAGKEALAKLEIAVAELKGQQRATAGLGLSHLATRQDEVSGVDTTQRIDLPSAYLHLFEKGTGQSLGVYLLSSELSFLDGKPPQAVPGQVATIELRPKRHYKDYTLHLKDFKFDRYVGTETARNYSSDVRLEDPGQSQDRDVTIRMNEPLRHRGDAIFQSSFTPDEKATILQVVSNPGWQIPYISCLLVMGGMLLHFVIKMGQFLVRSVGGGMPAAASPKGTPAAVDLTARTLSPFARFGVPVIAAVLALLFVLGLGWPRTPKKDDKLNLQKLATLPVVDGGRVKPLDSVARVNLRLITHAEEYTDANGKKQPALRWLMDTAVSTPDQADGIAAVPLFRVDNDEVCHTMKLPKREGRRYAWKELFAHVDVMERESQKAAKVPEKQRSVYQVKLLELAHHMEIYQKVVAGITPLALPPDPAAGTDWRKPLDAERATRDRAILKAREELTAAGLPTTQDGLAALQDEAKQRQVVDIITRTREAERAADPALAGWGKILTAYSENTPADFDAAVGDYRALVTERVPPSHFFRADLETYLNQSGLFYWCTFLYGVAGVGSLIGFALLLVVPNGSQTIRRGVFWWLVVTFAVHTLTLLARMYLMDRPLVFVTNLYSSAVFIGWGVVGLCLILEMIYPIGFGNVVASALGVFTTIIAHNLAASGDTLEMMQAVLDTNFWLATHVTTVTLGYSATYVAGLLGLIYITLYVLPERSVLRQKVVVGSGLHQMSTDIGKILGSLTYAVVCFATLLSFVGTVLGGIWADQSWGRFWGWDPKENGAVLIVLWNALILHARWGGMVKERGTAVLAVGGIIITTWSWFGTNQLGVGLHAYGFNNGLVMLCDGVWVGALLAILVGVLPWQWVYGGGPPAPTTPPQARRA